VKTPFSSVTRITTPVKAWFQRFAFLLLLLVATALMIVGKTENALIERLRASLDDTVAPFLEFASQPVSAINRLIAQGQGLAALHAENLELRAENAELLKWRLVARELEAENSSLRSLAGLTLEPQLDFISARVVGDAGGAFARSLLINAGLRDQVEKGQAVLSAQGLAGRVIDVGLRASRVLLVTDINSRVPVFVGGQRHQAILAGSNSEEARLLYLDPEVDVFPGDAVVTSGQGGVLPPGLPVGVVSRAGSQEAFVQPFTDWGHLEIVKVTRYDGIDFAPLPPQAASPIENAGNPADRKTPTRGDQVGPAP
jgi:rod shape-determining protein MreC